MTTAKELRKAQKNLVDEFVLSTDKMDMIMGNYMKTMKDFHDYSLGNLILAHYQLMERNVDSEGIDLLGSYRLWQKKGRQVRRGEKALYILAPRFWEIKDEETGEVVEKKMWFKKVPVFDISQTDGEPLEEDYTTNNLNFYFNEIVSRVEDIKVNESNKQLTRGYTDGKEIWVSKYISDTRKICVLFHEMAHYYLHFGKDRKSLTKDVKELEAEAVSYMVSSACGIVNDESSSYIREWAGSNAHNEIQGRGQKLIDVALKIIDDLKLGELVEFKQNYMEGVDVYYLTSRFMEWGLAY
jgi:hypothetical protein